METMIDKHWNSNNIHSFSSVIYVLIRISKWIFSISSPWRWSCQLNSTRQVFARFCNFLQGGVASNGTLAIKIGVRIIRRIDTSDIKTRRKGRCCDLWHFKVDNNSFLMAIKIWNGYKIMQTGHIYVRTHQVKRYKWRRLNRCHYFTATTNMVSRKIFKMFKWQTLRVRESEGQTQCQPWH